MKGLVWVGCLSLLAGAASAGPMTSIPGPQPAFVPAPAGVQLQGAQPFVDVSALSANGEAGTETTVESAAVPVRTPSSAGAIRAMLTHQAADWDRGDLDAFASGYKNSPDILFIGKKISRGYDQMLATYKQSYATRAAMGTLTFADLEVQPLDDRFATVTGHFHLERTATGGGNADGYFLLVVEDTADGWKIVRDDTTALPGAAH